ncbi:hypothetical protein MN116_003339 [Schistosoma mekongi]|uniref:Uncharacterized protein n=1 Tax=Schistosoma mekongi TaxID=38744 RepID=A0AAE2D8I2_SCHME|nr:hypothetical protein MN116_003339 [Schistosoma mekongi]
MRNCCSDRPTQLTRIEVHLKENEKEIKKLKQEVKDMRSRSDELLSHNNIFSTNGNLSVIKNLDEQIDSLKEELKYETALRSKIEEELSCALSELRFYRTSTMDDIAYQEKNEFELQYEKSMINFLNELKAQIHLNLSSSIELEDTNRPILEKGYCNEKFLGFGNLRKAAYEFKNEVVETCRRGEIAIKSLDELQHKHSVLQKQYSGSHELIEDALHKVAGLIYLSQTLTKERDGAIQNKEKAESELSQLRLVINKLTEESTRRTREEVDKVKAEANKNIENLLNELHHMEKERYQLAVQLECYKTKDTSNHINDIYNEGESKLDCQLDSFRKRAIHAENLCDELKLRLETECNNKERLIASKQVEIEQLSGKNKLLSERFECAELERKQNENRYNKQNEALFKSELQLNDLKQQLESLQKSSRILINSIKQSMKMQEVEYKLKIETLEKVNKLNDDNWRSLLDKQQTVSGYLLFILMLYHISNCSICS